MLRIAIPSNEQSRLSFSTFQTNDLPKPPNGIDEEGNDELVLLFEDEEEAVNYADALEDISAGINDDNSPIKLAINDIIVTIQTDEFVQDYLA